MLEEILNSVFLADSGVWRAGSMLLGSHPCFRSSVQHPAWPTPSLSCVKMSQGFLLFWVIIWSASPFLLPVPQLHPLSVSSWSGLPGRPGASQWTRHSGEPQTPLLSNSARWFLCQFWSNTLSPPRSSHSECLPSRRLHEIGGESAFLLKSDFLQHSRPRRTYS